jgi:predicted deacetylase
MNKAIYYLIRLDDACPTLNKDKWEKMEKILDKYSIKPMVGIIPNNKNVDLEIDLPDSSFWEKARFWQEKGWTIALHGFDHVYLTNFEGINPVQKRSEFAGLLLKEQEEKIEKGLSIFKEHNIHANYFYAPSHTFDENTLKALLNKANIRKVSDTIARFPYKKSDIIFYPQQFGSLRNIKIPGYWTFCIHPNTMDDKDFYDFENLIQRNHKKFISFEHIDIKFVKPKSIVDKVLSFLYFARRKIR